MKNVSETTRAAIWNELIECSRLTRYYGGLGEKMNRRHTLSRMVMGGSALIGIVPMFSSIPSYWSSIGSLGIIAVVVLDYVQDYGKKAHTLGVVRDRLMEIMSGYRRLWDRIQTNDLDAEAARAQFENLENQVINVISGINIRTDEKLNHRSQVDAYETELQRYAHV